MSEAEVPETGPVSVDDVLQAIQQKNIGQAKSHFQDLMNTKVQSALDTEKVKIANQVFNGAEETPEEQPEVAEIDQEDADVETEVEDTFDEFEVEAEVE